LLDRETAVLRQEDGLSALQPLSDVLDCLDLFGSWHSLLLQRSNPSTKDEGLRRSQPALVGSLPFGPGRQRSSVGGIGVASGMLTARRNRGKWRAYPVRRWTGRTAPHRGERTER